MAYDPASYHRKPLPMIRHLETTDPFVFLDHLIETTPEAVPESPDPAPMQPIKQPFELAEPTMSSLQIADITGKRHSDVLRDIETILEQAEISQRKFASTYADSQGKPRPCYLLPRRECDLVISGYSVKYRLAIIDRWRELESKQSFHIPQSLPEALRLAADLSEQLSESHAALAIAAPKAAGLDRIAASEGSLTITAAAKTLRLAPRYLFQALEARKWIYRRAGEWCAYQDKQDAGLMSSKAVTFQAPEGERTTTQARITPKGLARLARLFPSAETNN